MSMQGLIITFVITAIVGLWVLLPLLRQHPSRKRATQESTNLQQERLIVIYERVLTNIRDLDEDYATGKISSDDYEAEREIWVERGITILRAMDEQTPLDIPDESDEHVVEDAIEAAVKAYRQNQSLTPSS